MITEADLAAAWESGYWHGTSHEGPLNDAVVAAKNPYKATGDAPAKTIKPERPDTDAEDQN
jgi:hypothetical protein